MIEEIVTSNIGYAVGGGAVYGGIFALRALQDGEAFEPLKFGLTVVFAGLLGLAFEVLGYDPAAHEWFLILFAYTGMIASIEQSIKFAVKGYYDEARDSLGDAARDGTDATVDLAGGEDRIIEELMRRISLGDINGDGDSDGVGDGDGVDESRRALFSGSLKVGEGDGDPPADGGRDKDRDGNDGGDADADADADTDADINIDNGDDHNERTLRAGDGVGDDGDGTGTGNGDSSASASVDGGSDGDDPNSVVTDGA